MEDFNEDPIEVNPFEKKIKIIKPIPKARKQRNQINTRYEDMELLCMLIIIYIFITKLFAVLLV